MSANDKKLKPCFNSVKNLHPQPTSPKQPRDQQSWHGPLAEQGSAKW